MPRSAPKGISSLETIVNIKSTRPKKPILSISPVETRSKVSKSKPQPKLLSQREPFAAWLPTRMCDLIHKEAHEHEMQQMKRVREEYAQESQRLADELDAEYARKRLRLEELDAHNEEKEREAANWKRRIGAAWDYVRVFENKRDEEVQQMQEHMGELVCISDGWAQRWRQIHKNAKREAIERRNREEREEREKEEPSNRKRSIVGVYAKGEPLGEGRVHRWEKIGRGVTSL